MSLYFIEGPAGTGKTTRLFEELERVLEACPLAEHQQVARDNQGENAATIRMRMPRRLAAL